MQYKFFFALAAAFASSCHAELTAKEATSSIDTITQNILDLEVLVDSISKENATDLTALQVGSNSEASKTQHASQLIVDGPGHRRQLPRPRNNQRGRLRGGLQGCTGVPVIRAGANLHFNHKGLFDNFCFALSFAFVPCGLLCLSSLQE